MDQQTTYVAHNNDLYRVIFRLDGYVEDVTVFPESNGGGHSVLFWRLPLGLRDKIESKIEDLLE